MERMTPTTIVIPCHDDAEALSELLARLAALRRDRRREWRLLFVDDGSADDTFPTLLRAACNERGVSVLRHPAPRGIGAALRTAFAHVDTPIVCTMDSRCTYPPERLPELAATIDVGADVATVAPRLGAGTPTPLAVGRRVSGLYRQLVGRTDLDFFTCLFRAYRRDVLARMSIRADGIAANAELLVKALRAGCTVRAVGIPLTAPRHPRLRLGIGDAMRVHAQLLASGARRRLVPPAAAPSGAAPSVGGALQSSARQ